MRCRFADDKSGEGFKALVARQVQIVLGFEIADVERGIEHQRGRIAVVGAGHDVELIFDFADQLLQHVFDADHAGGRAELIDHHGEMAAAVLELVQQIGQRLGFGNHQNVSHDVADRQRRRRGMRLRRRTA